MKQAIEQVTAELKAEADHSGAIVRDKWADQREYHDGREDGLIIAIEKLREVLSYETSDTYRTDGNGQNDSGDGQAHQV